MDNHWSDYIQTTKELYASRDNRFTVKNKDVWISHIGVNPGMKVLEVGCAGGIFCHNLKKYIPDLDITGLDFDRNHIIFAREKAKESGLCCTFVEGEIGAMPFADGTFDLVYSHTVAEHVPPDDFFGEQRRVLKPGGRITVLSVRTALGLKDRSDSEVHEEEKVLLEKLWSNYVAENECEIVGKFVSVTKEFYVYKTTINHADIAFVQALLGGAGAVQIMEQLIAGGVQEIIAAGCCGALAMG